MYLPTYFPPRVRSRIIIIRHAGRENAVLDASRTCRLSFSRARSRIRPASRSCRLTIIIVIVITVRRANAYAHTHASTSLADEPINRGRGLSRPSDGNLSNGRERADNDFAGTFVQVSYLIKIIIIIIVVVVVIRRVAAVRAKDDGYATHTAVTYVSV